MSRLNIISPMFGQLGLICVEPGINVNDKDAIIDRYIHQLNLLSAKDQATSVIYSRKIADGVPLTRAQAEEDIAINTLYLQQLEWLAYGKQSREFLWGFVSHNATARSSCLVNSSDTWLTEPDPPQPDATVDNYAGGLRRRRTGKC